METCQDKQYYQIGTTLENLQTSMIIPTTYADSYKAYVVGNYKGLLKVGDKLYNLPSLIFTGSGGDLSSSGTYFIANKGQNLPYKLNSIDSNNQQTPTQVLKQLTGKDVFLTGVTITDTNYKTFTGTLGYSEDVIGVVRFGEKKYLSEIKDKEISQNSENGTGNCLGIPNNAVYFNNQNTYLINNTNSLTASFAITPLENTCQFRCSDTHTWDGTQCKQATNPICFGLIEGNYPNGAIDDYAYTIWLDGGNYPIGSIYYKFDQPGRQNGCGGRDGFEFKIPPLNNVDEIIIPTYLSGVKIEHIISSGMCLPGEGCDSYTYIKKIVLPPTLKTIGHDAFYNMSLENITIPNSVTSIGDFAFFGGGISNNSNDIDRTGINGWSSGNGGTWILSGINWIK